MALWAHLAEVLSKLEHFPSTQQNENKIAYKYKANENLFRKEAILNCFQVKINKQQISFPMCKTIRKVTTQQLFELFYFFRQQK